AAHITMDPANQTVNVGDSASFSVTADGTPTIVYVWHRGANVLNNGGNISGADTPTLTINPVGLGDADNNYYCVVNNTCGGQASNPATLTVNQPCTPVMVTGISGSQTVPAGGNADFMVSTSGSLPITYQWRRGTTPLIGDAHISGVHAPHLFIN